MGCGISVVPIREQVYANGEKKACPPTRTDNKTASPWESLEMVHFTGGVNEHTVSQAMQILSAEPSLFPKTLIAYVPVKITEGVCTTDIGFMDSKLIPNETAILGEDAKCSQSPPTYDVRAEYTVFRVEVGDAQIIPESDSIGHGRAKVLGWHLVKSIDDLRTPNTDIRSGTGGKLIITRVMTYNDLWTTCRLIPARHVSSDIPARLVFCNKTLIYAVWFEQKETFAGDKRWYVRTNDNAVMTQYLAQMEGRTRMWGETAWRLENGLEWLALMLATVNGEPPK